MERSPSHSQICQSIVEARVRALLILPLACLATKQADASKIRESRAGQAVDRAIANLQRAGCEGTWSVTGGYLLYGAASELRRQLSTGYRMRDEEWRRALGNAEVLRCRDKWPAGVPVAVSMNVPAWLHPAQIHAAPRDVRLKSVEGGDPAHLHCGLHVEKTCAEKQRKAEYQEIGSLEIGKHHIVFDVTVEEGSYEDGASFGCPYVRDPRPKQPTGTVLWKGPLAIDVEVVPALEDSMPANDSSELSDMVRRSLFRFPSSFERGEDVEGDVGVYLITGARDVPNAAFSIELELYRGDHCLARGWTLATTIPGEGGCRRTGSGRWTEIVGLGSVKIVLLTARPPPEELELRVRGVPKDVLRDLDAKVWWNGTVSIPLSSLPVQN